MRTKPFVLIPILMVAGCAGTVSVLGTPTVLSDTPYDLAPEVTNSDEIRDAMLREYPPLLRDAGIRGSVVLRLSLDETGQIQYLSMDKGSGHGALDEMALELARLIKFNPAQNEGETVSVLMTVPLNLIPPPPGRAVKRAIRRED